MPRLDALSEAYNFGVTTVGTPPPPVLADDDDATYIQGDASGGVYAAVMDTLGSPSGTSVTLYLRYALFYDDPTGDGALGELWIHDASDNFVVAFYDGTISAGIFPAVALPLADGMPQTVAIPLSQDALDLGGVTLADVLAVLSAGSFVRIERLAVTATSPPSQFLLDSFRVYEMWLQVGGGSIPERRIYPRPTTRIYPPPNTVQHGVRFGSSSIL